MICVGVTGRAEAMAGSVTEMRRSLSVVLMSSDLPTITRNGADPSDDSDWGGSVAVWVAVGVGFCDCPVVSACWRTSAGAVRTSMSASRRAPSQDVRTFIFRFLSL
ncbi:hypothetical protein SBA1_120097 [Candidatus Sulfotelmatobacter kueseliae]|uniref:Uncharacterized protein n=1 Tax=Candidatus Sulfotelmatobacter kueseliae TaxID=2042962 RepID=A0A2U3K273_9BACT|nr:hypothetical protein SBA1_120097 [Candidatus Sulfotelmatobacter kueseliae]